MHTVETEWWSMDLPEEWDAEQDEETIVIGDEDGVGMLEITALERGNDTATDLEALAAELFPKKVKTAPAQVGDFTGLYVKYVDEDDAVREWLVRKDEQILLVSYSCDADNAGLDDEIVDQILETLRA
jgi:hypothetical protein